MGKIIIEKSIYSFEDIRLGNWSESDPYFHQALSFCQSWLCGKEEFEMSTSGSTGEPKNIQVKRKQMEVSAAGTGDFFGLDKGSKLLCCLNIWMVAGKMMLVRALEWDAEVTVVKPIENPLLETDDNFDFVAMVPMQVAACLDHPITRPRIRQIKNLIIGGAPSSSLLIEKILEQGISAFQTYGMTETVSHIALAKISAGDLIYKVLPGVKIGTDKEKRLWIKAPMAGEKKLQTNDLVELLDEDSFKWQGRADFTINSGGIKLQPELMEPKIIPIIQSLFGHQEFFLFGKPDERLGQKLVLVIQQKEKDVKKEQDLLLALKENFNRYHLPKEILYVDELVKTASGKINRPESYKIAK
ncbi:AMP-binding protein [Cecembia rubra]|nr:AMP-binding protein [Cecembia rubra]